MQGTTMKHSLSTVVCLFYAFSVFSTEKSGLHETSVMVDGVLETVYFNDGDTFKIMSGDRAQDRVRITGMNTLETYGPVHFWANSDGNYLLEMAHEATKMARTGTWNCVTQKDKDGFGRVLANCDDLAIALIKAGYAHAYSIDENPANAEYLTAQKIAQKEKLGMWQFGVPEFMITSLHSAKESGDKHYNRLISAIDGHTQEWVHHDIYETCQKVCFLGEDSCMVYVPYEKRYGNKRPECLYKKP